MTKSVLRFSNLEELFFDTNFIYIFRFQKKNKNKKNVSRSLCTEFSFYFFFKFFIYPKFGSVIIIKFQFNHLYRYGDNISTNCSTTKY